MSNYSSRVVGLLAGFLAVVITAKATAAAGRVSLNGHVPSITSGMTPSGDVPPANQISLAIGLPLRNQAGLTNLLQELYDPYSTNFHRFLTPDEFTERFGPTKEDYELVAGFAEQNGLRVAGRHSNRVVIDVEGNALEVERAFQVKLRKFRHPKQNRDFFAPDVEPSVPENVPVLDIWGLTDFGQPQPLVERTAIAPLNYNGTGTSGSYRGSDFRNAYVPGTSLTGTGQIVAVVEFDGYYASDITNYEDQCGYPHVPLQDIKVNNVSGTPGYSGVQDAVVEVSLDIELAIAMAPGMTKLLVYEGSNPYDVFNRIISDNQAKQIGCSWAFSVGPSHNWRFPGVKTLDSLLIQMAAQGQSFFQASGDSDAYTGSQALSSSTGPIPVDSPYVTSVGGTTLTMSGLGVAWSSEKTWNYGNNTGSGGGISTNYPIPSWQAGTSMASNGGSTTYRNIPDVALTADAIQVNYGNGQVGTFGGTSCAAPLWAGFCALANQQAVANGGGTNIVGFLNPALYAIAASSISSNCFHDITVGNNIGSNDPGKYNAVSGYDLATGLGTPAGTNLINALAPPLGPVFAAQPVSQTVTAGAGLTLSAAIIGKAPIAYKWLFNGSAVAADGNLTGTTSNVLSIASAQPNHSGTYQLIATNVYGAATSSVAVLAVGYSPSFTLQPTNQIVISGGIVAFAGAADGSPPISYQWRRAGANLVDGPGITGATSSVLTLSGSGVVVGNYSLVASNQFGAFTSSAGSLTIVFPPTITNSTLATSAAECGANVSFTAYAAGTAPLKYQWNLDGLPVPGAINETFSITNLNQPDHTVGVTVTNKYGTVSSNATIQVMDTAPPVVSIAGGNPLIVELGSGFIDPGATASDSCAGAVPVVVSGTVNTGSIGTNFLTFTAQDGNGNTSAAVRVVIVSDTTPPDIAWSFTNLTLVADTNCNALMPDITGTNYIIADDLSGPLLITQSPLIGAALALGTNETILSIADFHGNTSYSTNSILVTDQTPPIILAQPFSQTNRSETTATFAVIASACTPISYQWYFNGAEVPGETNADLLLSSAESPAAGSYFVLLHSDGGTATSEVATLTIVTNHPPIAADIAFVRTAGQPLQMLVSDLATNWSDVDGDSLSISEISASTNGVTITNGADTLLYANANDVADEFFCTVSDGLGGTTMQRVQIEVAEPVNIKPGISIPVPDLSGSFALNLTGAPGFDYILEAATNLSEPERWIPIATNTFGTNGVWQFTDTNAPHFPIRFYRLKLAQ